MKKATILLLTITLFFIVSSFDISKALAADITSTDSNNFVCKANGTGVEITGYTGTDSIISIPSAINGLEVTSIGRKAFEKNTLLTNVTIPGSVKKIGGAAFRDCSSLNSVTISYGVTDIEATAFFNCYSLKDVSIPDSVTHIGGMVFAYCGALPSITIPSSVTSIDNEVFDDCPSLREINVDRGNQYYSSDNGVLFNKNQTTLIRYPAGNTATSYAIPDSVTSIDPYAFNYSNLLTNITFSKNLTNIGELAFRDCDHLTSINLPMGLLSVGYKTFENCSALTSVTIPESVTNIGENAFSYCISLPSITIPDSVTSIGYGAFCNCYALKSVNIPNGVTSISGGLFYYCESLTNITIPSSVTSIGYAAFNSCTSLTSITIPGNVKSIDEWAFLDCYRLNSIIIQNGVTSIGKEAFLGCSGASDLIEVTIPKSVTSIGNGAFDSPLVIYGYSGSKAQAFAASNGNKFIDLEKQVSVSFDSNGGSLVSALNANSNTTIAAPTDPTKSEYTFAGWYKDKDLTNPWDFTTNVVTGNITLYAKWIANSYKVYFLSSEEDFEGNLITADYNTTITAPLNPSRSGYIFLGWFTESSDGTKIEFPFTVTENTTLYAHWKSVTPSAPTDVNASRKSKSSIIVKWSEVSGAGGYELYYGTSRSKITKLISTTDSLSYTKAGLKSGKNYYFKVRAYTMVKDNKVYSRYSAIVKFKL